MHKTTERTELREEALASLRAVLAPGSTVYTVVRSVSRSNLSRTLTLLVVANGAIQDVTAEAARVLGLSRVRGANNALRVSGAGMNMCARVVFDLGRALFPNGGPKAASVRRRALLLRETDGGHLLRAEDL